MDNLSDCELERLAEKLADRLGSKGLGSIISREGFCDQREALQILAISRSSLYRLIDEGNVARYKFGRANRFDRRELLAFLARMRKGSSSRERT